MIRVKAGRYTQGNSDARDGYPMNRFMRDDPDYKEGYEDMVRLVESIKRRSKS